MKMFAFFYETVNEVKTWEFSNMVNNDVADTLEKFGSLEDGIAFVREYMKLHQLDAIVYDIDYIGSTTFHAGVLTGVDSEHGVSDTYMMLNWLGLDETDLQEVVGCSSCGDGGCKDCLPSRF